MLLQRDQQEQWHGVVKSLSLVAVKKFDTGNVAEAILDIVPPKDYVSLALKLGLRLQNVQLFEEDHGKNSRRVLLEIVHLWIRNVTDPVPSWDSLVEAVEQILD